LAKATFFKVLADFYQEKGVFKKLNLGIPSFLEKNYQFCSVNLKSYCTNETNFIFILP
jgi:hypothetical protein